MADDKLSGKHWVKKYPTKSDIGSLKDPFKKNVQSFVDMLKANGAKISIAATLRPKERGWLMHHAYKIAKGSIKYDQIKSIKDIHKTGINWDHGDEKTSKAKADEMVKAYDIAYEPSLTSHHFVGNAIDMTITGLPKKLKFKHKGKEVEEEIGSPAVGSGNSKLHDVGKKYFSVVKHKTDKPHWSVDGK